MKKAVRELYYGICFLFLYAPIVVLIVFSFNESKNRAKFTGFSFRWYRDLFRDQAIMTALWNTLLVAICAAVIATVIGTIATVGISNMKRGAKTAVMNMTYLPVINPEIITGISLMLMFVFFKNMLGWNLGFWSVLIAHISFCLPYVILNVLPKLRQMDPSVFEAALDLGCNPVKAFFRVVLPEISSGIFAGFLMSFTFSLDDFIITYFTNGNSFQTISTIVYSMTRKQINPKINALSAIIFAIVLAMLLLMNVRPSGKERKKGAVII